MIGDGSCQKCPSGCISCSSDKNCTCCSHGRYVAFPCYLKKIILKNERDRLGHILLTRTQNYNASLKLIYQMLIKLPGSMWYLWSKISLRSSEKLKLF